MSFSTASSLCLHFPSFLALSSHRKSSTSSAKGFSVITENKRRRRIAYPQCQAQLSELAPTASSVYGALLLGGGVFAFGRSGSKGSLIGGLTGAVLMAATFYLMQEPDTKYIGDAVGFGSAFLFTSVFGIRLAATRKLVPAGLLLGLSACALTVFVGAYLQDKL